MQALSERFELRLDQNTLDRIDAWRGQQYDVPSRAQAVRRLVENGLAERPTGRPELTFSTGERLIIAMLIDMMKAGKVSGDTSPKLIADILYGGHNWALRWELGGLFHDHVDSTTVRDEVVDFLDMWDILEESLETLSDQEKAEIKTKAQRFGGVKFMGFDGNGETEHMSIARFLVDDLKRFSRFKGRDFNSHIPQSVETYRRMYSAFAPLRPRLTGRLLSVEEILVILAEAVHPTRRGEV